MKDIRSMQIWKEKKASAGENSAYLDMDIHTLDLSRRSYNSLMRAGCETIRDVLRVRDDGGKGLKGIRNLGERSEKEILQKLEETEARYGGAARPAQTRTVIRPAKRVWDMGVEEFGLSERSLQSLSKCGIRRIGDLYAAGTGKEPGWYAVRELFEKVPDGK